MDNRLESRYVVIKTRYMDARQRHALETFLWEYGVITEDCVVIESDWPEYTPVVDMLMGRIKRETSS